MTDPGAAARVFTFLKDRAGSWAWLVAVTLMAYANAVRGDFYFDDLSSIVAVAGDDYLLRTWNELLSGWWIPGRRLVNLSFAITYEWGGLKPEVFRAGNILIHLTNGLLVFELARRWMRSAPGSAWASTCVATWYALNPLLSLCVTYSVQRATLMATGFSLMALWLGLNLDKTEGARRTWMIIAVMFCAWAALQSKEIGVMIIPILGVIFAVHHPTRGNKLALAGLGAAVGAASAWTLWSTGYLSGASGNVGLHQDLWGVGAQVRAQAVVLTLQVMEILAPLPRWLTIDHAFPAAPDVSVAASVFCTVILLGAVAWLWKHPSQGRAGPGTGMIWLLGMATPYFLIPNRELLVDYKAYVYAPAVAFALAGLASRLQLKARGWAAAIGVVSVLGGIGTHQRNTIQASARNMWTDALEKNPNSARVLNNLAAILISENKAASAKALLKRSVAIAPSENALINLATLELHDGEFVAAEGRLEAVLQYDPVNAVALQTLAETRFQQRDLKHAETYFLRSLRLPGVHPDAQLRLATIAAMRGDLKLAHNYALAAMSQVDALNNLPILKDATNALLEAGLNEDAARVLDEILKREPGDIGAALVLAQMSWNSGDAARSREYLGHMRGRDIPPPILDQVIQLAKQANAQDILDQAVTQAERASTGRH